MDMISCHENLYAGLLCQLTVQLPDERTAAAEFLVKALRIYQHPYRHWGGEGSYILTLVHSGMGKYW